MDRFELVEKLVKSTGVSYAEAKAALEAVGWDLLDAAVWLEKNGKAEGKTSHFSTNPEQQEEQRKQQEEERRREEFTRKSAASQNTRSGIIQTILRKAKEIIMDNELVVCKRSGEVFLEVPIWLFIILLVVSFWPVVIAIVLLFIVGFRYRLHGPDLGSEKVNSILNRAENAAGDFIDRMKNPNNTQKYKAYDATKNAANKPNDDVIDYQEPKREE